jgi:hypothetical protein
MPNPFEFVSEVREMCKTLNNKMDEILRRLEDRNEESAGAIYISQWDKEELSELGSA